MPENNVKITLQVKDDGSPIIDQAKGKVNELNQSVDQSKGPLSSFQEGWMNTAAKLTIATTAFYAASRGIRSFVDEAAAAEEIENRLRYALETTGYSWKYAKSSVDQFANSVQEMTRFSDEQARQALTDMMMYTRDFAKAQEGARLAMDMSIRTGQDLTTTARYIGMAFSGNAEMLGRYIPELRNLDDILGKNATMAQKAEYAMKVLNEKFGGTAQADVKTYSGTVAQFKNAWSDLKETIGMALLPVLKELFEWLTKVINLFKGFAPESASAAMLDRTISKLREQAEELKGIASQPGLVAAQREMIASQLAGIDRAIKKLEEYKIKNLEAQKSLAAQIKPDVFAEAKKEADTVKEIMAAYEAMIQAEEQRGIVALAQHELAEGGWAREKDIVEQVKEELLDLERVTNEWGEITVGRQELVESGWQKIAEAEAERLREGVEYARLMHEAWLEEYTRVSEWEVMMDEQIKNIANIWTSGFSMMRRSGESFSDWFKKLWLDMADYAIAQIFRIAMNFALTGSPTGKKGGTSFFGLGGGWGGLIGGILKVFGLSEGGYLSGPFLPIRQFQGGGYVSRPTLGIIGEGGEGEYIIPESKMRGAEQVNNFITIIANDAKSFDDMVRRNPSSVIGVAQASLRNRGTMHRAIRRY